MPTIFSNSPFAKDWVRKQVERLASGSSELWLASPYFTEPEVIVEAAAQGKRVQLVVGLNMVTRPDALLKIHGLPGVFIRFYTDRFHAKLFIFDEGTMIGSSNLTGGGLMANREGTVLLDPQNDPERCNEIQALFSELWNGADVLTKTKLDTFAATWKRLNVGPDPQKELESRVGHHEPPNIATGSQSSSKSRTFMESLRHRVYELYGPAFLSVHDVLTLHGLQRPELTAVHPLHGTNRFLNWLRLTHVHGDDAWKGAPIREEAERRKLVQSFGEQWVSAEDNLVPPEFVPWLERVGTTFGSAEAIEAASLDEIGQAFVSLHAFTEQLRFVKGGLRNLLPEFWEENSHDLEHVKSTISYLLHHRGDFAERLHDVLYDPALKIRKFGEFSALELFGTVNPEEFPPINGRMVKALRFLGYPVA